MEPLFLLPGGVRNNPDIDLWLSGQTQELGAIAHEWFTAMRRCGDDVLEVIHDGAPTACVGDAAFAYVNAFKAHVNVGFFWGAALADPAGLLEGSGKRMRHVKLRPGGAIDSAALADLIEAAYADIRRRLTTVPGDGA
ncbi:MAG: DUF1801 domain-containing protein [Dehalococcoidia bacterium]